MFKLGAQEIDFTVKDFNLTGTAVVSGGETFMLTDNLLWQGGAIWYRESIDLSQPFKIDLDIYFGCSDGGADGIVFILHPELSTGFRGEGMGFGGLYPSFGVEMDTYQNFHLGDPHYDHVALMAHGTLRHQFGITEPVPLIGKKENVEDCDYHRVLVEWKPSAQRFSFIFDGRRLIDEKVDLVDGLFEGNPNVYWGFSSATGGKRNRHLVRLEKLEFTENPALLASEKEDLISGDPYTLKQLEFAPGSINLPESAKPELDKVVKFFENYPQHSLILDGFTDSSGSEENNLRLSKLRVEAIAEYLRSKGVPESRIYMYGNGEANPIESNETSEGRKKNRRVEIRMKIIRV